MNNNYCAEGRILRLVDVNRSVSPLALGALLVVGALSGAGCINQDGMMICGTLAGLACPNGMYCEFEEGTCGAADEPGVCIMTPMVCTEIFSPVCGCDGVTYGNDCNAAAAGVSIESRGECEEAMVCGTIAGIGCPDGMYCAFDEGRCNVADDAGVCEAIPDLCIELFAPVCGCDGMTYGNDCMAASAGVSLDSQGACTAP